MKKSSLLLVLSLFAVSLVNAQITFTFSPTANANEFRLDATGSLTIEQGQSISGVSWVYLELPSISSSGAGRWYTISANSGWHADDSEGPFLQSNNSGGVVVGGSINLEILASGVSSTLRFDGLYANHSYRDGDSIGMTGGTYGSQTYPALSGGDTVTFSGSLVRTISGGTYSEFFNAGYSGTFSSSTYSLPGGETFQVVVLGSPIPEPSTYSLLLSGVFFCVWIYGRFRQRRS